MNKSVVIVAGGKGTRMGTDIPKQFLSLAGRPVLMHTIEVFHRFDPYMQIVLVLPLDQQDYWKELCEKYGFGLPVEITGGGETRFHSVRNGLSLVPEGVIVGIHDGVRPLVSGEALAACYKSAEQNRAAFPVIPVIDSLRKVTPEGSIMVNRSEYFIVQTPQVFYSDLIKTAYKQPYSGWFTDDVSVFESVGGVAVEVPGNRENIKITGVLDLELAEILIAKKK
ncbi:2-C-methyl-D-erythritol 4-phosphate cytidylyltransferase [Bacteroidia bacterium]|nr:2-C-methyl-D-erythritol 4-phosphate cytidylyltransferase [Bacteroidia bacterium]GHU91557.1 2-C-methyl-D-erythritol 4-phosphate cytidylyltransferase [Bacteroidia bacterium]